MGLMHAIVVPNVVYISPVEVPTGKISYSVFRIVYLVNYRSRDGLCSVHGLFCEEH